MNPTDPQRRSFLGRLASGTLTLAGLAAISPRAAEAAGTLTSPRHAGGDVAAGGPYDDSWTERVRNASHKAVFDSPDVNDGLGLLQPWIYRAGYRAALNASFDDIVPVVVLRHQGTALALDDALWAKYEIGKLRKVNEPGTSTPATRNPWARQRGGDQPDATITALLGAPADPTVEGVLKTGGVVLCCEVAMKAMSRMLAAQVKGDAGAILAELRAGLVPGVIVQPSGVYATTRAQEAGATFMRST